jgi:hypothetical protein
MSEPVVTEADRRLAREVPLSYTGTAHAEHENVEAIAQAIAGAREAERQAFVNGLTCDDADTDECTHFLCRDVMAIARRSP